MNPKTLIDSESNSKRTETYSVPQIRFERSTLVKEYTDIEVLVDGIKVELLNLSETGLACSASSKLVGVGQKSQLKIQFDEKRMLYEGPIIIAWEHQVRNEFRFGARFSSHILSESFPQALEATGQLKKEVETLRKSTEALPLEFKALVLELKCYLQALKLRMDKLERDLLPLSSEIKKSHRKLIELWISPEVIKQLQKYNMRLFNLMPQLTELDQRNRAIDVFRAELNDLMLNTPFTERALNKPRGYAGDYELMNQIYRDEFEGGSFYAQIIHKYSVSEASSASVRYRKEMIVRKFQEFLNAHPGHLHFASLACGPAKEVVDFLSAVEPKEANRCLFTLIDQDTLALLNCKRNIYQVILERELECEVNYTPVSVKDILERSIALKQLNGPPFDLLYTVGLYDYLTQPLARALTQELTNYLKPGGKLIIGNFHPGNPTKAISEFLVDWKLIYRTDDEMMDLVPDSLRPLAKTYSDEQDMDLFVEITKD